jgi:hypothetical protein
VSDILKDGFILRPHPTYTNSWTVHLGDVTLGWYSYAEYCEPSFFAYLGLHDGPDKAKPFDSARQARAWLKETFDLNPVNQGAHMAAAKKDLPTKLALHNFKGVPVAFYLVDRITLPEPTLQKEVAHHIYVVDVSGSMYGVIKDTASMIEKVMTIEEFSDETQFVSLISYSSKGDVTLHFSRVPVAEVLKPGSRYVEAIRSLRAQAMTCASQAFAMALDLVGTDMTAISLHTDGFFNDPSPIAETRSFDALIERAKPIKNLMVNTIAYGSADYVAMSRISNALSGKCVKATTIKDVYAALHDTQALLAGRLCPVVFLEKGDADYQMSLNVSQRKVNGTTADLTVRGNRAGESLEVFRFRKVTEEVYNASKGPLASLMLTYAFARAKLAEGKLNEAKFALCSTKNLTLLKKHAKALTNAQLTAMALELEISMFVPEANLGYEYATKPGLPNADGVTLLELFELLNEHKSLFTVDFNAMMKGYHRKSMKKVAGTWSHEDLVNPTDADIEAATFTPCAMEISPTDDASRVSTKGFKMNNAEATVNILVERPAKLLKKNEKGEKVEIHSVAGLTLDKKIYKYNNLTIISNGDVNINTLPLRIEKRMLHAELVKKGVFPADSVFDPKALYEIPLSEFPVVPYDQKFSDIPADLVIRMGRRRSLISLCDVLLKIRLASPINTGSGSGGSGSGEIVGTGLIASQEAELWENFLSTKLNFEPPMRVPYTNKKKAVAQGLIDSRPKYTIDVGDKDLLSIRKLLSANAFFERRFSVTSSKDGVLVKPKIEDLFIEGNTPNVKPDGKMKMGASDKLLFSLYEGFVMGKLDAALEILAGLGIPKGVGTKFLSEKKDLDALQQATLGVQHLLEAAQEKDYATWIRPLAFYMGSSGLVPDGWNVQVLDANGLKAKFKDVGKGDEDATYLVAGDLVITLSAESVDILTETGLAAVKKLSETVGEEE